MIHDRAKIRRMSTRGSLSMRLSWLTTRPRGAAGPGDGWEEIREGREEGRRASSSSAAEPSCMRGQGQASNTSSRFRACASACCAQRGRSREALGGEVPPAISRWDKHKQTARSGDPADQRHRLPSGERPPFSPRHRPQDHSERFSILWEHHMEAVPLTADTNSSVKRWASRPLSRGSTPG